VKCLLERRKIFIWTLILFSAVINCRYRPSIKLQFVAGHFALVIL